MNIPPRKWKCKGKIAWRFDPAYSNGFPIGTKRTKNSFRRSRWIREIAKTTSVTVKTTIWVFRELLEQNIIDAKRAEEALTEMKAANRRVPYSYILNLIDDFK